MGKRYGSHWEEACYHCRAGGDPCVLLGLRAVHFVQFRHCIKVCNAAIPLGSPNLVLVQYALCIASLITTGHGTALFEGPGECVAGDRIAVLRKLTAKQLYVSFLNSHPTHGM